MAEGRRQFGGELVCYLIAWIPRAVWEGKPINPDAINPYKPAPPKSAKLQEIERWQGRRMLDVKINAAKGK